MTIDKQGEDAPSPQGRGDIAAREARDAAIAECKAESPAIKQAYYNKHVGKWWGGDDDGDDGLRNYVDGTTASDRATDDKASADAEIWEAKREADKVKRLKRELKDPAAALARAREDDQEIEMQEEKDEEKESLRGTDEKWGDVRDEWIAEWIKNNWDEEAEADFVEGFNKTWLKDHGTPFPQADGLRLNTAPQARRAMGHNSDAALAADIGEAVAAEEAAEAEAGAIDEAFEPIQAAFDGELEAHNVKRDAASAKIAEARKTLVQKLVEAKNLHQSQKAFRAFLETHPCGLHITRAEDLIRFATGRKDPEQYRLANKANQQKVRDKKRKAGKLEREENKARAAAAASVRTVEPEVEHEHEASAPTLAEKIDKLAEPDRKRDAKRDAEPDDLRKPLSDGSERGDSRVVFGMFAEACRAYLPLLNAADLKRARGYVATDSWIIRKPKAAAA